MKTLNDHEDFELLVIVLILANCATLAMFDPMQSDESQWNSTLNKLGETRHQFGRLHQPCLWCMILGTNFSWSSDLT